MCVEPISIEFPVRVSLLRMVPSRGCGVMHSNGNGNEFKLARLHYDKTVVVFSRYLLSLLGHPVSFVCVVVVVLCVCVFVCVCLCVSGFFGVRVCACVRVLCSYS